MQEQSEIKKKNGGWKESEKLKANMNIARNGMCGERERGGGNVESSIISIMLYSMVM